MFGMPRNTASNTDPARRQFVFKVEQMAEKTREGVMVPAKYGIELASGGLAGNRVYMTTNVKDGGHGCYCMREGQGTNNDRNRSLWCLEPFG